MKSEGFFVWGDTLFGNNVAREYANVGTLGSVIVDLDRETNGVAEKGISRRLYYVLN